MPDPTENVFTLSEPLEVAGKTYNTLLLAKPGLKGSFLSNLAAEYRQKYGELPTVPMRDEDYRILFIARINGLDVSDLQDGLSAEDYALLSSLSLTFLNKAIAGQSTGTQSGG